MMLTKSGRRRPPPVRRTHHFLRGRVHVPTHADRLLLAVTLMMLRPRGPADRGRHKPRSHRGRSYESAAGRQNRDSSRNPLAGLDVDAPGPQVAELGERRRGGRHRSSRNNTAPPTALEGMLHIALLLAVAAIVAVVLLGLNHVWSASRGEASQPLAPAPMAGKEPAPVSASPAAVERATDPVAAVKLMIAASLAGDTRTAYAQWNLGPEQIAGGKPGQELTLAEVTRAVQRQAAKAAPESFRYRVLTRYGTEVKVALYREDVCLQIFSLRKLGPHWRLYHAAAP